MYTHTMGTIRSKRKILIVTVVNLEDIMLSIEASRKDKDCMTPVI